MNIFNKQLTLITLICILITASMLYIYDRGVQDGINCQKIEVKAFNKTLKMFKLKKESLDSSIATNLAVQEERSVSLNKRFDDFYILGGIILTLVFILIASVYIKSEKDVKSHLDQNFEAHKNEIQLKLDKANSLLSEIETIKALVSRGQNVVQNDVNTNGDINQQ
jgi:predicted Holliday junction resolvase-like endonuclease